MTKAIGIKVKKAEGEHDLGASKFFGTPTLPSGMAEAFKDTEIFFCQIRCRDIAEAGLIAENDERIPHSGYLYVFLDTAEYPYRARVLHCVEEPAIAMGFRDSIDGYCLLLFGRDDYDVRNISYTEERS